MSKDLNAKRFAAAKPLRQPAYNFDRVPRAKRDLQGSTVCWIKDRDHFLDSMAEMVLLCKEAAKRSSARWKRGGGHCSKPLSLEYMADRLDVDDPLWGLSVRSREGEQLQGFCCVTTFTNWQATFRWDSMHDSAFSYDDPELARQMASGTRMYDRDGSLAEALQATVRCGDPWNEGIVWPRIAELSLLGGLGCGKTLLSLVIEKLERMNSSGIRNYDYLVLQATDNSIPFYESLGFVRVGCITEDIHYGKNKKEEEEEKEEEPPPSQVVSSAVLTYKTSKHGETLLEIAKRFQCDIWDIIFLNHFVYKDMSPRSRLMKGTQLFIPHVEQMQRDATSHASRSSQGGKDHPCTAAAPQWFIASENDTPRQIAKQFDVSVQNVVLGNRQRLPELQANSRLKEGTRIKVSHFHLPDDKHVPYCHWTFPDDTLETCGDAPSYMMALPLQRKRAKTQKPVEESLAVPIHSKYVLPKNATVAPPPPVASKKAAAKTNQSTFTTLKEPVRPKRPLSAYMLFCAEARQSLLLCSDQGQGRGEVLKLLSQKWNELDDEAKRPYRVQHQEQRAAYQTKKAAYQEELCKFRKAHPNYPENKESSSSTSRHGGLFNKVVQLVNGPETSSEFEYYYVLTYIPDLQWCHLAPLQRVGVFGNDKPRARGRPIWMLVPESLGKELDISATYCQPVSSRSMKRTANADQEQWDILEGATGGGDSQLVGDCRKPGTVDRTNATVAKRKPGRPRTKEADATRRGLPTKAATDAVVGKRGPGRPPNTSSVTCGPPLVDELRWGQQSNEAAAMDAAKRGPGRLKSAAAAAPENRGPGRPPKSAAAAAAAAAAPAAAPEKRGPPKAANDDFHWGAPFPAKTTRGRPPKTSRAKAATSAAAFVQTQREPPLDGSSRNAKRPRVSDDTAVSTLIKKKEPIAKGGPFAVGDIVEVQARTWPGINKLGGVARVVKVHKLENGTVLYDVSYVLGGKEKNVDAGFVSARVDSSLPNDSRTRSSPRGKRTSNFRYAPPDDFSPNKDRTSVPPDKADSVCAEPDKESVVTAEMERDFESEATPGEKSSPIKRKTRSGGGTAERRAAPELRTSPRLCSSVVLAEVEESTQTQDKDCETKAVVFVLPKPVAPKSEAVKLAPMFTMRKKKEEPNSRVVEQQSRPVRQAAPLFGSPTEPGTLLLGARRGVGATTRAAA